MAQRKSLDITANVRFIGQQSYAKSNINDQKCVTYNSALSTCDGTFSAPSGGPRVNMKFGEDENFDEELAASGEFPSWAVEDGLDSGIPPGGIGHDGDVD